MQFRFCDKKLTPIFWHCTRACHVVLPSDPNGNPAAHGYSSCSLEFRTRRLSLTADGPGTRKFVWNDGPVCVTWFPSYLQPWALERSWSYKRWYCQYLSACRVWLFSHDLSRSQFHWETESMLHQGHCWLVVLLPSSNDVGCEFTVNCHCDGRQWGVDLQYKPSRLGPPVTLCDYDNKDNG